MRPPRIARTGNRGRRRRDGLEYPAGLVVDITCGECFASVGLLLAHQVVLHMDVRMPQAQSLPRTRSGDALERPEAVVV